jgi:hypothetical protein
LDPCDGRLLIILLELNVPGINSFLRWLEHASKVTNPKGFSKSVEKKIGKSFLSPSAEPCK